MSDDERRFRSVWMDVLALYPVGLVATIPYAVLIAREDGLPGNTERIIATAAAAALGFWFIGSLMAWFRRNKSRRFLIAALTVVVMAGFAFIAAYKRG